MNLPGKKSAYPILLSRFLDQAKEQTVYEIRGMSSLIRPAILSIREEWIVLSPDADMHHPKEIDCSGISVAIARI